MLWRHLFHSHSSTFVLSQHTADVVAALYFTVSSTFVLSQHQWYAAYHRCCDDTYVAVRGGGGGREAAAGGRAPVCRGLQPRLARRALARGRRPSSGSDIFISILHSNFIFIVFLGVEKNAAATDEDAG